VLWLRRIAIERGSALFALRGWRQSSAVAISGK
jgi:hypothetical protein